MCLQSQFHIRTLATRTAPAFDRPFAPYDGSDLLSLRLHFRLQRGDVVFHAAPSRRLTNFARFALSPPTHRCFVTGLLSRTF